MPADLAAITAAFGHRLHEAGVPVTPERSAQFARSIAIADPMDLPTLYWLGRITLLTDRTQVDRYDEVFRLIFRGEFDLVDAPNPPAPDEQVAEPAPPGEDRAPGGSASGTSPGGSATGASPGAPAESGEASPSGLAAMSTSERHFDRDFAQCSDEELALIRNLVERLPLVPPLRRAQRTQRHRSGRLLDVRGSLRRAHRTGGDPVDLVTRRRTQKPRRIVLIADVSGSMAPYARIYLHLLRGAVRALHAEAFVFATHLTRLTRTLAESDADTAYRRAVATAWDWSSGTRIGHALHTFIEGYGRRGMARGAIVVIVSDGWEVEDPALIAQSMERLSRLAHRIIWVNPRKAATDYEPLVRGMAAALPYVDTFVSGHSVRALQDVMDAIRADDAPRLRLAS